MKEAYKFVGLTAARGTRFSCTPYYHSAPTPLNPVPPVESVSSQGGESPKFHKKFQSSLRDPETPIWKSIQYLDHEGIEILRQPAKEGCINEWEGYLSRTGVSSSELSIFLAGRALVLDKERILEWRCWWTWSRTLYAVVTLSRFYCNSFNMFIHLLHHLPNRNLCL